MAKLEIDNSIRKNLKDVGRTEVGRVLCEVIDLARKHYSSIATIDKTRSADAQIEGRQLMCEFLDELEGLIVNRKRERKPGEVDDWS